MFQQIYDFVTDPVKMGAVYGAVQLVAQAVMALAPSHTIAFKIAKYIVSGKARPAA